MSLLTLLNGSGWGSQTSDLPDLYLEWSPTTGPRETPVWERIPLSDIRQLDLNRGRNRELDRFQPGRMSAVLDNRLRRYDPLIGEQSQYIDLPGTSGNYASTPDSAAVSITGDIDIRVRVSMDDWSPAATQRFLAKEVVGDRSYGIGINSTPRLLFRYSVDGTTALESGATAATGFTDGTTHWLKITRVASTGVIRFFTADDVATTDTDSITFTQLGADVAGTAGALFNSSTALEIGSRILGTVENLAGNVYYAEVRNGIGDTGVVVARFDANTVPQQATRTPNTWVADDTGETWTVNGSAWNWGGTWGSPYSGNIKPMRRIRLRAVWDTTYDLFTGYVDSWDQNYDMAKEATVTVTATDGSKVWERYPLGRSVYDIEVQEDNPIIWWRLDETNADPTTTARNAGSHGTAGDGTYIGPVAERGLPGLVFNDPGTAIRVQDTVGVPDQGISLDSSNFNLSDYDSFAIEFWVTPAGEPIGTDRFVQGENSAGNARLAVQSHGTEAWGFRLVNLADTAEYGVTGNVADQVANTRYHIVAKYGPSSNMAIYVNGTKYTTTATGTTAPPVVGGIHSMDIGFLYAFGDGLTPEAIADEFAIYVADGDNDPLSDERVTAHFNAGVAPWNGDTTGERIERLADAIGWPAADRDIDTGESTLQSAELGGSALDHAQLVRDTEYGEFFMLPNGNVRFVSRHARWQPPYNTPLFTLSDDGADLGYGKLRFNYDDQLIRNKVTVGYANGLTHTANSTSSQDSYLIQGYNLTGLIGDVDSEGEDYANYIVGRYDEPLLRVEGISITPQRDPATMWPAVLAADLVYTVNVERTPQAVGSAIDQNYTIEGVSHHIEPKFWRTELQLSPADTPGAFILDSTSQGILDTNTLGW